jgi:tryptophanyl-tRNA synthetase
VLGNVKWQSDFPSIQNGVDLIPEAEKQMSSILAAPGTNSSRPRVLSGMRPTGKLHLGNYMGALANWVKLQDDYECYFFIADLHALTTDYADPSRLKLNTLDVALDWLAAGLDPERSTIFIQSHVPQHAELHLLFSMITPLGWLERVPTYKEQQENIKGKDLTTYGFLGYPLLQAADILLYQPQFVPVGQDQVAHVELTREVARRFNSMYKTEVFPEPGALLTPSPKLPGTDGRKMSKSYGNTIPLASPRPLVFTKIQGMSTNGQRIRQTDPGDPDLCPVGDLHKVFSPVEVITATQLGCRTATIRCETCKLDAAKFVSEITQPIYDRRKHFESKIVDTWEMLREQSKKAAARAEQTMLPVRTVLDLTHDLGSLQQHFTSTDEERRQSNDLSGLSYVWDLPSDQRSKEIRQYWRSNVVPYEIRLSEEANRTFASIDRELEEPLLTQKKKRVLVIAAVSDPDGWNFRVPPKSYEVWTLICLERDSQRLADFVIPQNVYAASFARVKKLLPKGESIHVLVERRTDGWKLSFPDANRTQAGGVATVAPAAEPAAIDGYLANYDPIR